MEDKVIYFDNNTPKIEQANKVRSMLAVNGSDGTIGAVEFDMLVLEAGKNVGDAVKIDGLVLPTLGVANKTVKVLGGAAGKTFTYGSLLLGVLPNYESLLFWDGAEQTWSIQDEAPLPSVDTTGLLSKNELNIDGINIDLSPYIQFDKRINSAGSLVTSGALGCKVAYMVPFSGTNLNVKGFNDSALRNFSWYNSTGTSILNLTINNNQLKGDLLPTQNGGVFFSLNIIQTSGQPEPALVVKKDVAINSVDNTPIKAMGLGTGNSVPNAVSDNNAVNLGDLKLKTFNLLNSKVMGSNNLGLKSLIKDRGYYIGVNGTKTNGTGWHTFVYFGLKGMVLTFHGINSIDALYYSFFNLADTYITGSVKRFNDGITPQPITVIFPADGYIVIDMGRPGDDKPANYALFMLNEGNTSLPYVEPVRRTISNIGGFDIATDHLSIDITPPDQKTVFSFTFDDGKPSDSNVETLFDSFGLKCGFALITGLGGTPLDTDTIDMYLARQAKGYEVLCHSKLHGSFSGNITAAAAEAEMRDSLIFLKNAGFNVTGWVTPSSTMRPDLIPLLRKYYEYGYTVYFGESTSTNLNGYNTYFEEKRMLKRVSLESTTYENLILQVDEAIAKGGIISFYGHVFPSATMSQQKISDLLTYLIQKRDNLECEIDIPREANRRYFEPNNQLISNMWNALNR